MILVDSSTWVEFLRGEQESDHPLRDHLRSGQAALCPIVWVELWRGARGRTEEESLLRLRELCEMLVIDGAAWEETAVLARLALRAGLNCPLADIAIVACARRHKVQLLHRDKHMARLQML